MIKHLADAQDPLSSLLDEYYLKRDKSSNRLESYHVPLKVRPRPPGRLSPSKLCGCERQAAFVFVGMPGQSKIIPDQEAIFDDGNWRHHKWQATFYDMEKVLGKKKFSVVSIEEAVEIPELYIAGSLDACVRINQVPWIVDFKGINQWGFDRVFREKKPLDTHVLQLLAYMRAKKVRKGMIFYEEKNSLRYKVFSVQFTPRQWQKVKRWSSDVIEQLEERRVPPKSLDCSQGNFLYDRCPFSRWCWNRGISEEDVHSKMYDGFISVEETWNQGRSIVANG
jgi:CRISPR/Cas system-associated exonuclease Cas4 (RecB family)